MDPKWVLTSIIKSKWMQFFHEVRIYRLLKNAKYFFEKRKTLFRGFWAKMGLNEAIKLNWECKHNMFLDIVTSARV